MGKPLDGDFYARDVLEVAPALLGTLLCRRDDAGTVRRGRISEVEAYRGEEDSACHARFGRTKRAGVLYLAGGHAYVYLCYGIHAMMNVVTGAEDVPQAVLIRALADGGGAAPAPAGAAVRVAPGPVSPARTGLGPASPVLAAHGPGRLTKALGITTDDNRRDLRTSRRLWIEDDGFIVPGVETTARIGIGYATPEDQARLWRYVLGGPGGPRT